MGERSILARLEARGRKAPRVLLRGAAGEAASGTRGRYEILGLLAEGGSGEVLRGRDVDLGRDVALKVLRDAKDPERVRRFVDEAQITGQLQHPGVVPLYELGLGEDGRPFLAMKLVKGRTLSALMRSPEGGRHRLLQVFERVCRTVAYAHERGVVHRDLKSSNVMAGSFGEVQVLDWGSARVLPRGGVADERRTRIVAGGTGSSSERGAAAYLSPEAALGEEADERSDVFSLGAILCEILSGEPPYAGEPEAVLAQAREARLGGAAARLDACGADAALVALARQCLAPLRRDRPRHAGEVADAVLAHLSEVEERAQRAAVRAEEAQEEAESAEAEAARQVRARRQTVRLGAVVLLALVVAAGGYGLRESRKRESMREAAPGIDVALAEAQARRGEGSWAEARSAARRAALLAEEGDAARRERARRILESIEAEAAEAERDLARRAREEEFLRALDEVRLRSGEDFGMEARTEAHYVETFRERGIDVAGAVAAIGRDWTGIRTELAAAFDAWALRRRVARGDWERVLAIAEALDPDPWRMRLRAAFRASDVEALKELRREASRLPPSTISLLAVSLWSTGAKAEAIETLRAAWHSYPEDFWINCQLGSWLREREPQSSLRYSQVAVALRPGAARAWNCLADARAGCGDHAGAEDAFRMAWRLAPRTTLHAQDLTMHLSSHGRHVEAVAVAREAVRLRPDAGHAHDILGVALHRAGDHDGAIASAREAVRLEPESAVSHANLGTALQEIGDLASAIASHREATRLDPAGALARYNLGNALKVAWDPAGAIEAYRAAIDLDPEYAEAYCNLGHALRMSGHLLDGLVMLRKGHELGARRPDWPYRSQRWIEEVERWVEQGPRWLAEGPTDPRDALAFAEFLGLTGRHAEAVAAYARAFAGEGGLASEDGHRYNAACFAVLAGGAERRAQALEWLRAERAAATDHWLKDPDLAAVRDRIEELPEGERGAWRELWAEVRARVAK